MADVDGDFAARNPRTALYHVLVANGCSIKRGPAARFSGGVKAELGHLTGDAIRAAHDIGIELERARAEGDCVIALFVIPDTGGDRS